MLALIQFARMPIFRGLSAGAKEGGMMRRFWQRLVSQRFGERLASVADQRPGPVREIGAAILVVAACILWRALSGSPQADAKPPLGVPASAGKQAAPAAPSDQIMALRSGLSELSSLPRLLPLPRQR
jgi:hypothetical protein